MRRDYYSVMGLPFDASDHDIRKAYTDLARRYHPDSSGQSETAEQFLEIQAAYEVLSNPTKRTKYNASLKNQNRLPPSVHLNIRTSRSCLPVLPESQALYALIDIVCTQEPGSNHLPPTHVCLVIDRSTSMAGAHMDMVRANISQALTQLQPDDIVSIIAFNDIAETILAPTRVKDLSRGGLGLISIQTGGGTELYTGLKVGFDTLLSTGSSLAVRHLILMTDGYTYGDDQACIDLARAAVREGVSISAMGIGSEWHDQFLDHLAALGGGNAVFVQSGEDLEQHLQEKVRTAAKTYAQSLCLDMRMDRRVVLQSALRIKPNTSLLPLEMPLLLGGLMYGRMVSLLCEFLIDPLPVAQEDFELVSGYLHLDVYDSSPHVARVPVKICCPVKTTAPQTDIHPAILDALSRMNLYRMQEQANAAVGNGDYQTAVRKMKNLTTHLLSRGETELAHTVLAEIEHLIADQAFTPTGIKRIKYGTRALMVPPVTEMDL